MNDKIKIDYLKFIFYKAKSNLTRYNIRNPDKELINKIFERLNISENLLKDLYILSNIKDLKNIGKYFIFILKKIEDNVISFDTLSQNIKTDTEFIENEFLNYFSNPKLKKDAEYKHDEDLSELISEDFSEALEEFDEEKKPVLEKFEEEVEDETEITRFKKNYLELIQCEEKNAENVYELPQTEGGESLGNTDKVVQLPESENEEKQEEIFLQDDKISEELINNESEESLVKKVKSDDQKIEIKEVESEKQSLFEIEEVEITDDRNDNKDINIDAEGEKIEAQRIQLSEEIREEINSFEEDQKNQGSENNTFEEAVEEETANILFLEYENEVKEKNKYLKNEFERMINLVNTKPENDEERNEIIKNILVTSDHLESTSRKISLEIISNIYQTIMFSFEKISDGKYDISESTLNLFKKGLSLVESLIKGDDYFGYKDILKSIENIRNALIEEKEKREKYLKLQKEKHELEKKLSQKYPEDSQRVKLNLIKQLIKDTEVNFNSLDKISGEYQIYEALRSLSGNLNNFKEIVKLSKELEMKKLVQLSEAGYIFIKFLQNYRINPVTVETKEIFGYIIYVLKSLVLGKRVEDIDLLYHT